MIISLPHALDISAARYPKREAVRCHGKSLTYAELQRQANSLACLLMQQGVRRGHRVGLYMNKSLQSVVSLYAIMKAGAAYVPLDPYAPLSRLRVIISDCDIRCLITKPNKGAQVRQLLAETNLECLVGLSTDLPVRSVAWEDVLNEVAGTEPKIHLNEQDLSYILYTSGSTGTPKGIMHTHGSALSFAQWAAHEYGLSASDRVSNHAPLHFDLSTFDLYATVLAGATTVIIPEYLTKFPFSLSQVIAEERLSVWYSVPFALIQLLERGKLKDRELSALRWVLFAGEPFPTKHLRQLMAALPQARFSNLYGPTETNVCTYYHVAPLAEESDEPIPIGRPCSNSETLVVDPNDKPVALGDVGELLVRGGTVMRGYWGRPELNKQSFFRHSLSDNIEGLFYRTGDLVELQADGNYKYRGRQDRQIKTRGYRVELDEVEVAMLTHDNAQEAAVYTIPDGDASHLIYGAVIPKAGHELTGLQLAKHLSTQLPSYAIPVKIIVTDHFPRTSTGKIDRRKLQAVN
jgi:amino acid adenylation domain-containing protein